MSNILKQPYPVRVAVLAADPSDGENGTIYYNTTLNVMRKFENGVWANLDSGVPVYANAAALPGLADDGQMAATIDTHYVYMFDASGPNIWRIVGGPGSILSVGTLDGAAPDPAGAKIVFSVLHLQSASVSYPGLVNTTTQSFQGEKTFPAGVISPTFTLSSASGSFLLQSNASLEIEETAVPSLTATYLIGVTSPIQTQLDAKYTASGPANRIPYFSSLDTIGTTPNLTYNGTNMRMESNTDTQLTIRSYVSAANQFSYMFLDHARGVSGTPLATTTNDELGRIYFRGHDGSAFVNAAYVSSFQTGAASTNVPANLGFYTSDGSTTPLRMVIDSAGRLIASGGSASIPNNNGTDAYLQLQGIDGVTAAASVMRFSADAASPFFMFSKSRSATRVAGSIVSSNDELGRISYAADNGVNLNGRAAWQSVFVDGTPSSTSLPGRFEWLTTAAGAISATRRMTLDSSGRLIVGSSNTSVDYGNIPTPLLQVETTGFGNAAFVRHLANSVGSSMVLGKSRGSAAGAITIVQANDTLGTLYFNGADGTDLQTPAAAIYAEVDGTPGVNDMPGRLVFATTIDGQAATTEAMRIDSSQRLLIGATTTVGSPVASTIVQVNAVGASMISGATWSATGSNGAQFRIAHSKSGVVGTHTALASGDRTGQLIFMGSDGAGFFDSVSLTAEVDATVSTGIVPGRLLIRTANAAGTLTELLRVDSSVGVGIDALATPGQLLQLGRLARATDSYVRFVNSGAGSAAALQIGLRASDGSGWFVHNDARNMLFGNSGIEAFRIDSAQNISMGTNASAAQTSGFRAFDMGGTSGSEIWMRHGGTLSGRFAATTTTTSITAQAASSNFQILTGGGIRFQINSDGSASHNSTATTTAFNITATADSRALQVTSASAAAGVASTATLRIGNSNATTSNYQAIVAYNSASAFVGSLEFQNVNHNANGSQTGQFAITLANAGTVTEKFRMTQTGGSTLTSSELNVAGLGFATTGTAGGTGAAIAFNNTATGGGTFFVAATDSGWGAGGSRLLFGTGTVPQTSNAKMTLNSSGQFLIGDTASNASAANLQVTGAAGLASSSVLNESTFLVKASGDNQRLGIGNNVAGSPYSWLQSSQPGGAGAGGRLDLQPIGGTVTVGSGTAANLVIGMTASNNSAYPLEMTRNQNGLTMTQIINTTSGTGAGAGVLMGAGSGGIYGYMRHYSALFTSTGSDLASSTIVAGSDTGGLVLAGQNASTGTVKVYTGNALKATFLVDGRLQLQNGGLIFGDSGAYGNSRIGASSGMTFRASTSGGDHLLIDSAGKVGISTTSSSMSFNLHIQGNTDMQQAITTYSTAASFSYLFLDKARGTNASPSSTANGDEVGRFYFRGHNGTSIAELAYINGSQVGNVSTGIPGQIGFFTCPGTSGGAVARMFIQPAGHTAAGSDNAYSMGTASLRWSVIFSATGAINTSDEREKTDIDDADLGLDFIKALRPVKYRWLVGKNEVSSVCVREAAPAQPMIVDPETQEIVQEPTPEVTPLYEEVTTPVEGVRTHYGLLAQQVKQVLPEGLDFAGWTQDDPNDPESRQGLRYDQFIAPLIKSVQQLSAMIEALTARIVELEG